MKSVAGSYCATAPRSLSLCRCLAGPPRGGRFPAVSVRTSACSVCVCQLHVLLRCVLGVSSQHRAVLLAFAIYCHLARAVRRCSCCTYWACISSFTPPAIAHSQRGRPKLHFFVVAIGHRRIMLFLQLGIFLASLIVLAFLVAALAAYITGPLVAAWTRATFRGCSARPWSTLHVSSHRSLLALCFCIGGPAFQNSWRSCFDSWVASAHSTWHLHVQVEPLPQCASRLSDRVCVMRCSILLCCAFAAAIFFPLWYLIPFSSSHQPHPLEPWCFCGRPLLWGSVFPFIVLVVWIRQEVSFASTAYLASALGSVWEWYCADSLVFCTC